MRFWLRDEGSAPHSLSPSRLERRWCCCCCGENSLPLQRSILYCFFLIMSEPLVIRAAIELRPHHLPRCSKGKPRTPIPSPPLLREDLMAVGGSPAAAVQPCSFLLLLWVFCYSLTWDPMSFQPHMASAMAAEFLLHFVCHPGICLPLPFQLAALRFLLQPVLPSGWTLGPAVSHEFVKEAPFLSLPPAMLPLNSGEAAGLMCSNPCSNRGLITPALPSQEPTALAVTITTPKGKVPQLRNLFKPLK